MADFDKEKLAAEERPRRRRHSRSLFGPVLLIAIGLYFLLTNLGIWPTLNWGVLFSMWPLLLIFLGLNIIVQQVPRPWGTLLSGLVSLAAVVTLALLLFFGPALVSAFGIEPQGGLRTEAIAYAPEEDVDRAQVRLDFNAFGAEVAALQDNPNLIAGEVSYTGRLDFDTRTSGQTAIIELDTSNFGGFWGFLNFGESITPTPWEIGLSDRVPIDLELDLSSGRTTFNLVGLQLERLEIDGSSGRNELRLPAGNYSVDYDASSGAIDIYLPDEGEVELEIDGSSGRITLHLPEGMEARVVVEDQGSGGFDPGSRFEQVEVGRDDDEGTWETAGFAEATDRITIILSIGSGRISIES